MTHHFSAHQRVYEFVGQPLLLWRESLKVNRRARDVDHALHAATLRTSSKYSATSR